MKAATILLFTAIFLFVAYVAAAEGSAGEKPPYESRYIVDMPTAGVIPKGEFAIYSQFIPGGGIMVELAAAPFSNFNMALSFGGSNIIGSGDPEWQRFPGVQVRWRVFDESAVIPAMMLGVNTQGRGKFDCFENRFETHSPGFFASASKSFSWQFGTFAIHGGLNYSLEPPRSSRAINFYCGMEHSLGKTASINFEYNARLEDAAANDIAQKALLNAALRWSFVRGLTIELQARDLLVHLPNVGGFTRYFGIEYIGNF